MRENERLKDEIRFLREGIDRKKEGKMYQHFINELDMKSEYCLGSVVSH